VFDSLPVRIFNRASDGCSLPVRKNQINTKTNTYMKKTITEYDFIRSFDEYNRSNNFSTKARKELFQYLEECEADSGTEFELDPIALCCDYTEYDSIKECVEDFKHLDEFEMCESSDDYRDVFACHTQVVTWDDDCVLIQHF